MNRSNSAVWLAIAVLALCIYAAYHRPQFKRTEDLNAELNKAVLGAIHESWRAGYTFRHGEELGLFHESISSNKIVRTYAEILGLKTNP